MRRLMLPLLICAGLACSSSSDSGGGDAPIAVTIFEVQGGGTAAGTRVSIDAYVMARSSAGDRIWIADAPGAAARAGVEVFVGTKSVPTVQVGQKVTVVGTTREFGQGTGLTVTQIASPDITIIDPAIVAPIPVPGLSPAEITLDPVLGVSANGEAYEGVLIQLTNLAVTSTSPFTLSNGAVSFAASAQIVTLNDPVATCYASVTGIWNYDVVTDHWIIVPTTGGLVTGGTCAN